jgi:hypothetical protein
MIWQFHFLVYNPKIERRYFNGYLHTHVHSSIIQKVEATQVSMNEWMDKQNKYIMEYYSALKRKEILTHTAMWMNLEGMFLDEVG